MRRKAAPKVKSSITIDKPEVTTASDDELESPTGSEVAVQNSAVAITSKRGRKKGMTEPSQSGNLNSAEENSDKVVAVPKRGRKPANKNFGGAKDLNSVKEQTSDNLKSEKSSDDKGLKVSGSSESQTVNNVPKSKNFPKAPAKRGRKKADSDVLNKKSAIEEGSNDTEQEAVHADDKEKGLISDKSDFQLPSHSTTKNAGENSKKKIGPARGKKTNDNYSKDVNQEESIQGKETENTLAVDDIYVAKDNTKSNPPLKKGRKRKNDAETALPNQSKDSPAKSDMLVKDDDTAMMEEYVEEPKRGRKLVDDGICTAEEYFEVTEVERESEKDDEGIGMPAEVVERPKRVRKIVKCIPAKASNENAEAETVSNQKTKAVPNPKGRSSKRKVEKNDGDEKEKAEKVPKKDEVTPPKKSKKEKIPDVTALDFSSKSINSSGEPWNFKISSWNINGIRAWLEKDGISYLHHEKPDILCVQETKCSDEKLPEEMKKVDGFHAYWLAGDKEGYSGVGLLSKEKPLSVEYGIGVSEHDMEGRVITAEYEKFYLVTAYVPNAGRGLVRLDYRMQWDKDFCDYIKKLDEKKPIILCGDLNVAHEEIDLANPKTNKKNAGFTKEEREGFSKFLEQGFVDTFRHLYPDTKGAYTFWTYMMNARAKNVGWRLDYFVTSKRFNENVCDSVIRKDVYGSDHCPITLLLAV